MHTGNAILVYFSDGSYFCISSASDDQLSVHNLVLCLHVHLSKSVKYNYSSSSSSLVSRLCKELESLGMGGYWV